MTHHGDHFHATRTWLALAGALLLMTGCPAADDDVSDDDTSDDDISDDDDTAGALDADGDGYPESDDCDDSDPLSYPGADEICDGVDNDCDGVVPDDEADLDGDGMFGCEGDCDDADETVYDGAEEICDGLDNDCDDEIPDDEGDDDGDGVSECGGDCNDEDASVYPEAAEACNAIDDDCDTEVDEGFDVDADTYTTCGVDGVDGTEDDDCDDGDATMNLDDTDGDLFTSCGGDCNDSDATLHPEDRDGDLMSPCDGDCDDYEAELNLHDMDGDGYDTCAGDCNDSDFSIHPGATEACNGVDDDCDLIVPLDELDLDGDGFLYCLGDCDDNDANVHPGAEEVCDGVDTDCDPFTDENHDLDGDGFSMCDGDCDLQDPTVYPNAPERCDGLDNDCDGVADDVADADGDGYDRCDDCDDFDPFVNPGEVEDCGNGLDDDCDGGADGDDVECGGGNPPGGFRLGVSFVASGGPGPGTADVIVEWFMLDDPTAANPVELCSYTYLFEAEFPAYSPAQGDDHYIYTDGALTFVSGTVTATDCPAGWDEQYAPVADPLSYFEWWISPIAIVSCEIVNSIAILAGTQLVDDPWGLGLSDGTMDSWCNEYGPIMEAGGSVGPMEGVWLRPSDSGMGDYGMGLNHLPALNADVGGLGAYDSWAAFGFVFADTANTYEPVTGLEEGYTSTVLWEESY